MTVRDLAKAIAAREKWKLAEKDGAFVLSVDLPTGRKQNVTLSEFDHEDAPMVRFLSRVGGAAKLDAARLRTALELNGRFPTGCLAIESNALVMTDTRPLATTTAASSSAAVRFLAAQADTYERFIYKTDEQ